MERPEGLQFVDIYGDFLEIDFNDCQDKIIITTQSDEKDQKVQISLNLVEAAHVLSALKNHVKYLDFIEKQD